jgi:hypothetical protein
VETPLASGRDADVWALDDGRVLRRYRHGGDAGPEAAVMARVGAAGYPVPRVYAAEGTDMVLERLDGETMLDAMVGGRFGLTAGAHLLVFQERADPPAHAELLHVLGMRRRNPTMTPAELAALDDAAALVRTR